MDMTDNQRRWWFATHPEYRRSRYGRRRPGHIGMKDTSKRLDPKQVDEYVDNALQYVHGPVAEILKSTKRNFGTEAQPSLKNGPVKAEKPIGKHEFHSTNSTGYYSEEPGIEEDWDFYFDLIPIGRFLKASVPFLRSLLGSHARHTILNAVNKKTRRWRIGDDPIIPTPKSRIPSWTTQARRTWKNEAAKEGAEQKWLPEDLERMKRGRPPRRKNLETGEWESMELHHHPVPRRDGGTEVIMVWPEEHAIVLLLENRGSIHS